LVVISLHQTRTAKIVVMMPLMVLITEFQEAQQVAAHLLHLAERANKALVVD
jgi:hypothetical protein